MYFECRGCGSYIKSFQTYGAPDGPLRGPLCFDCFIAIRGPMPLKGRGARRLEAGFLAEKIRGVRREGRTGGRGTNAGS